MAGSAMPPPALSMKGVRQSHIRFDPFRLGNSILASERSPSKHHLP
jgi:hypothetical protein